MDHNQNWLRFPYDSTVCGATISTRTRIGAPCTPCPRHGDPMHATEGLTAAAACGSGDGAPASSSSPTPMTSPPMEMCRCGS
eukprot:COSAG01_NODE_373_length_17991_cov_284.890075_1_plen_82_part_00